MGLPVLILGKSGAGKTTSLRNYKKGEILVLNVASKFLPFRSDIEVVQNCNYPQIAKILNEQKYKTYAIDDSQYLLCFEWFSKVEEKGFEKYTVLAMNFYNLIQFIIKKLPNNVIVFLLHHTENADGEIKIKTIGKMLDEKLTIEGLFSVVYLAEGDGEKYVFQTHTNGKNPVKTPLELYDGIPEIDNDLKAVEKALREYYKI